MSEDVMKEDFTYDVASFILVTQAGSKSLFDHQLESSWNSRNTRGLFKYKIDNLRTKFLEGNYKFVVQLNINRATLRRAPQIVTDICMPFDAKLFNFGRVLEHEKMFEVKSLEWGVTRPENQQERYKHLVIINTSPLEYCHSLFVPNVELCYPQILNFDAVRAALEILLCSADSYLRMGYNSLGAYASVNHLHFHMYHLKCNLYLETAPVEQLYGPCYYLISYPAEGFAFEILSPKDVCNTVRAVMILIDFLLEKKIPHNVFMTRGTPFSSNPNTQGFLYKSLRIYVWAREPYYGLKAESTGFNLAVCELSGHIPMKDQESYDTVNEDDVIQTMRRMCHGVFVAIREDVNSLFINRFNI